MSHENIHEREVESNPERSLSRDEILAELSLSHSIEKLNIERELSDVDGVYLLEVLYPEQGKRVVYQRKGSFEGKGSKIESSRTTIRVEDLDDGYSRTIADYDPIKGEWVNQ